MEERQQLKQDCAEWALRVSSVKTMVLNGLGKTPRKYCLEIIDQCNGENWESLVIVKKRKRSSEQLVVPYQVSEIPPMNGIIEQCLDQMLVESKEDNSIIALHKEGIVDHDDSEEESCQKTPIVLKEEILEIESPSHI